MSQDERTKLYQRTVAMLKPALERVVRDPGFRERLEREPLTALAEAGVELDDTTRVALGGKRFSVFWAERRAEIEGPVAIRDLPPEDDALDDAQLASVAGGLTSSMLGKGPIPTFAPPYVPVGPVLAGDNLVQSQLDVTKIK